MSDNDFGGVLAICADLLFAARIRGAAGLAGVSADILTGRTDVLERARTRRPARIFVDLDARWVDVPVLIRQLKDDAGLAGIPVIAFVSHVREDAIAAARDAGADRVLARSAFVKQLPELLRT